MSTKLTPEILLSLGFVRVEEDNHPFDDLFRLSDIKNQYGNHGLDIEVSIGNYPESNPNSGVVAVYIPPYTSAVIPDDLWDKEDWTEEDQVRADNNLVPFEESRQPIAWHVVTEERLKEIVKSLTLKEL